MAGLGEMFGQSMATVNGQKPRNSDRIQAGQPLNLRGAFEAATNIPGVGDALSGGMAMYDAAKGDYGSAAMNALGVLPFVSAGMVKGVGKAADALKSPTKFELAHETARKNAVEMLGLPETNTAMDRARAMGFEDAYHGTDADISVLDKSKYGSATGAESAKTAFWAASSPSTAAGYADYAAKGAKVKAMLAQADAQERLAHKGKNANMYWDKYDDFVRQADELETDIYNNPLRGQNVMPLMIDTKSAKVADANGAEFMDMEGGVNNLLKQASRTKKDVAILRNLADDVGFNNRPADHYGVLNPSAVRSRFAAFDPARRHEADLLGNINPALLGAMGIGSIGAATAATQLPDEYKSAIANSFSGR